VADSTEFAENPGKEMCHHVISTEGYSGSGEESVEREGNESGTGPMQGCEPDPERLLDEESSDDMTVDEQEEIPAACSTPLRGAADFRIVTIEPPVAMPGTSGEGKPVKKILLKKKAMIIPPLAMPIPPPAMEIPPETEAMLIPPCPALTLPERRMEIPHLAETTAEGRRYRRWCCRRRNRSRKKHRK
jgi:hypothetical protein